MRGKRRNLILSLLLCVIVPAHSQSISELFSDTCDSIGACLGSRTGVLSEVKLKKVLFRNEGADFYFNSGLGNFPLRPEDVNLVRKYVQDAADSIIHKPVKQIFVRNNKLDDLVTAEINCNGRASQCRIREKEAPKTHFIEEIGKPRAAKGLDGRYIALWQSHGRYYNEDEGRWKWQRAPVHRTVEDIFTQSFVTPFLIPMLENAGAFVMSPRESDYNTEEYICDNDQRSLPDSLFQRKSGKYFETGIWGVDGTGFGDSKPFYSLEDTPFCYGTARKAACSPTQKGTASARWTPGFNGYWKGNIYISYKSGEFSSECALYKVNHRGGQTQFIVNQKKGGSCWIRLGEFEMDADSYVELSNATPAGKAYKKDRFVSADAVRFGGGMGKILRGPDSLSSKVPAWCEGAIYNMAWSGIEKKVFCEFDGDYKNDYASRGPWVNYLMEEKHIPFDLSLAFHTDAGVSSADSIVGTLAIYTGKYQSRLLAEMVQSQVVNDIRSQFRPDWTRRAIADKLYSESHRPEVPAFILELLSHQNYTDMTFGLDPKFRFAVSRAVYKGILKYYSAIYKKDYVVQPLPVKDFSASLKDSEKVVLSWNQTPDSLEPTAVAQSYTIFVREDGGGWKKAKTVKSEQLELPVKKGHIYSYKVVASNDGGSGFPSEILSVGIPENAKASVLIVNAFTDIRGPYGFEDSDYAGFIGKEDNGIPYLEDWTYAGEVYNFRRDDEWETDDDPGFGASFINNIGKKVAGNSFDYPYIHGKVLFGLGYAFSSKSASSFTGKEDCAVVDIIAGKQKKVFTEDMIASLKKADGKNIILSGAYIGMAEKNDTTGYLWKRFGFRWQGSHPSPDGIITEGMEIWNRPNEHSYCVENPSSIRKAGPFSEVILWYEASGQGAAVTNVSGNDKSVSFGFPLESLKNGTMIEKLMARSMAYFEL